MNSEQAQDNSPLPVNEDASWPGPTVGVIGGNGPAATALFQDVLVRLTPAATDQEHLDLVVLATPSGSHANHLTAAVAAGVPTVVDKPITVDAPSARKAVDAAAQAATPLTVFQNRRWDPPHLAARKLLDEGLPFAGIGIEQIVSRAMPLLYVHRLAAQDRLGQDPLGLDKGDAWRPRGDADPGPGPAAGGGSSQPGRDAAGAEGLRLTTRTAAPPGTAARADDPAADRAAAEAAIRTAQNAYTRHP